MPVAVFASQLGQGLGVSGIKVPDPSVAVKEPNLEPLIETEIAQASPEGPALNKTENPCAVSLFAMPIMSSPVANAHYVAQTGPFEGLRKKEMVLLKKDIRAQAAAVSGDAEPVIAAEVIEQYSTATATASISALDETVVPVSLTQLAKPQKEKKDHLEAEL